MLDALKMYVTEIGNKIQRNCKARYSDSIGQRIDMHEIGKLHKFNNLGSTALRRKSLYISASAKLQVLSQNWFAFHISFIIYTVVHHKI